MNIRIDLRSDTVTLPSNKMREMMANAELGDDVFSEDPTVNNLEQKAAKIMGMEAALLVPSGTMGNLISILAHCQRGTEIILGDKAHTFIYEAGGISAFGGIHSRQLKNQLDGTLDIDDIKASIRTENDHFPRTSAITLENTHNLCNGSPLSAHYIAQVASIAKNHNLKLHIDGARIFNAAVALDVDVKDLVNDVDSITFCLSKGLAAPVGSIICGNTKFIYEAKRIRKSLGGGMRQSGIIAACGLYALEHMMTQIKYDHQNTRRLAEGINKINGLSVDIKNIKSNILYFNIDNGFQRTTHLANQTKNIKSYPFEISLNGIHFFESKPDCFRLVTHYGITSDDIESTISSLQNIVQ